VNKDLSNIVIVISQQMPHSPKSKAAAAHSKRCASKSPSDGTSSKRSRTTTDASDFEDQMEQSQSAHNVDDDELGGYGNVDSQGNNQGKVNSTLILNYLY